MEYSELIFNSCYEKIQNAKIKLRQFSELRKKISEQENFTKETKMLKENQTNPGANELNKQDEECIRKHWKQS